MDKKLENFKAFIDYNNDGDFVDVGEEIAFWNNLVGGSGLQTKTFTTPASPTLNTMIRLRVMSARNTETITPCFISSRGQTHDFGVFFTDKMASVTIAASPSSTVTYGTNVTFTATPVNGGTTPTYAWYVNGTLIAGQTGNTYSNSSLLNGDKVYCILNSVHCIVCTCSVFCNRVLCAVYSILCFFNSVYCIYSILHIF